MNINTELINGSELSNLEVFYTDIENNFKNSININSHFKNEINKVYNKTLLNLSKTYLSLFNLKYLEMFELLVQHYNYNKEIYELSNTLINHVDSYFNELNDNLSIKNQKDFDELKFILKISSIIMESVIEDMNIELAYEVFFQIQRKIRKEKLYVDFVKFIKEDDF